MTPEIFQSLQGFTNVGLVIVIIGGGLILLTYKGYISFDFRTKDRKKEQRHDIQVEQKILDQVSLKEVFDSFNESQNLFKTATQTMKQMSNDNMHELAGSVLDVVKIRFEAIENLIQNEIAFQNKNLVSGIREEIKLGLNNIGGLKYEMKESTKKLNSAVNSFDKLCRNCEYNKKRGA